VKHSNKKKVIIVNHAMHLGGVETSLIGLLQSFDYTQYDVDLFLYLHDGEFMEFIPKEVNLLPQKKSYASLLLPFSKNTFLIKVSKLFAKAYVLIYKKTKINTEQSILYLYLVNLHRFAHTVLPNINNKTYDLGISFLSPHFTVKQKIKAKKKIAWIHTDYSKFFLDKTAEYKMWQSFDYIASIGKDSSYAFGQVFPALHNKVMLIENILPKEFVLQRSEAFDVNFDKGFVNLCSVGRFTYPKNFESIPEMARYLLEHQVNVKWYIIGYGGDEELIKSKIKAFGVEEQVIILGKQPNPYPFVKACDIYVQPSRYEGKSVTVREAQILAKPVVIANFSSAKSQLEHGVCGVIFPIETQEFASRLHNFIQDKELQKKLVENCQVGDFSNQNEIDKIYKLIN